MWGVFKPRRREPLKCFFYKNNILQYGILLYLDHRSCYSKEHMSPSHTCLNRANQFPTWNFVNQGHAFSTGDSDRDVRDRAMLYKPLPSLLIMQMRIMTAMSGTGRCSISPSPPLLIMQMMIMTRMSGTGRCSITVY